MLQHNFSSWGYNTKLASKVSMSPINDVTSFNADYLKPKQIIHEKPPSNNGIMPLRLTDTAKTSMDSLTKNEVADMNSSYLKQKPGTYLKDPILTSYSKEAALAELRSSAGELPNLAEPTISEDSSLKNKLKYLIGNDINNKPTYKALLGELQEIEKYVARFPITDALNDRLGAIQAQIDATLFRPVEPGAPPALPSSLPPVLAAGPVPVAGPVAAAEPATPVKPPIPSTPPPATIPKLTPVKPAKLVLASDEEMKTIYNINVKTQSLGDPRFLKAEIWKAIADMFNIKTVSKNTRASRVTELFKRFNNINYLRQVVGLIINSELTNNTTEAEFLQKTNLLGI